MEIFNREYWGKLALATKFVHLGETVIIGHNHRVRHFALESSAPSVFYETKGKLSRTMEHLDQMRAKGIKLVGQDEEAGISFSNFAEFKKWRPEVSGVGYFDSFFAWGQEDYQEFLKYEGPDRIVRTGSPRTLFWGKFGENFFNPEISRFRNKYGSYVLVITNTTSKNSVVSKRQTKGIMKAMKYDSSIFKLLKSREEWEEKTFTVTVKAINKILEETELNVLIRPHPVEDESPWKELFKHNARVFVDKTGAGTPMLLGAESVVHAGSTLGLESVFHEKNTVSLRNLIDIEETSMSANELSTNIDNLSDLIPGILTGNLKKNHESKMQKLVTRWSDPAVLTLQAEQILKSVKPKKMELFSARDQGKERNLISSIFRRIMYGKSPNLALHLHKRPQIDVTNFINDFERLQKYLQLEREVRIEELSESTFSLKPRI